MTADQAHNAGGPGGLPAPELGDGMHPLLRKLQENIKIIAVVAGAFVLVFGGYAIYDYVQTKRLASAGEQLGKILVSTGGEERVTALEAFVASAPAALETSGLMELAAALKNQERHEEALEVWNQLQGQVDPTLEPVVVLGKSEALESLGRPDEALTLLEGFKAGAPEPYMPTVDRRIAELAEESGDMAKALAAYRELEQYERLGPSVKEYLRYKIAQLEAKVNG